MSNSSNNLFPAPIYNVRSESLEYPVVALPNVIVFNFPPDVNSAVYKYIGDKSPNDCI